MPKFKLQNPIQPQEKVGSHCEDGKEFFSGQVVESERPLDDLFPNKFVRVGDAEKASEGEATVPIPQHVIDSQKKAAEEEKVEQQKPAGNDVTDQFPVAGQKGLAVFMEEVDGSEEFTVYKDGKPIADEKFFTKKSLNAFLKTV